MNNHDATTVITKAILPFGGGMRKFLGFLTHTLQSVAPLERWSEFNYHDLTCGSCSFGATAAMFGMKASFNDLSTRSYTAACGLFTGTIPSSSTVKAVVAARSVADESSQLANGFIHPEACSVFDSLWFARERGLCSEDEAPFMRYLGLRWAVAQRTFTYFVKHPEAPLDEWWLSGEAWKRLAIAIHDPTPLVLSLRDSIASYRMSLPPDACLGVTQGDCREVVKHLDFSRPSIVGLNPPTDGNARFMQSNKVVDSLITRQPYTGYKDEAPPDDLWKSLVFDTAKHVPDGHYLISFVGDGAVSWEEGRPLYDEIGTVIAEYPNHMISPTKLSGPLVVKINA